MKVDLIIFGFLVSLTILDISWNKNYQRVNWINFDMAHNPSYVSFLFSVEAFGRKIYEKRGW
jgi:hypothetical protein